MLKNVKFNLSPFRQSIEVVGNMAMKVYYPSTSECVTIQFNINTQFYKQEQSSEIVEWIENDETVTEQFDFSKNNVKDIMVENITYNVKLMNIGKENIQGQNSLFFEFLITWED